jgi:hypothetical protein
VFPSFLPNTDIVASSLNDDAGVFGAAMLVCT